MTGRPGNTTAMSGWGLELFRYRDQHQWSRREFAECVNAKAVELAVNVSLGERLVARWEHGEVKKPSTTYLRLLKVIGAPVPPDVSETAIESAVPMPLVHSTGLPTVEEETEVDEVERRNFLGAIGAAVVGSTVGLADWMPARATTATTPSASVDAEFGDVTYLKAVTDSLRILDQRHGGRAVLVSAESLLHTYQRLYPDCDAATAAAIGDLSGLVGWAYHDVGNQRRARQYLAQGLAYARPAGADSLAASILYRLGRVNLLERHPLDALRMFQLGQIPATDAGSIPDKARLLTNEAWAWAMLGDERQMHDALSRAEHELGLADSRHLRPWNHAFFTAGDFYGHKSVISNELALAVDDPGIAERYTAIAAAAAQKAIADTGPDRPPRSRLFDHILLASAALRLGETAIGTEAAWKAIELAGPIRSARANERFRGLVTAAQPLLSRSDVREIHREIVRKQLTLPSLPGKTAPGTPL
ncbi:hypothetical protein [Nocardia amamiensis]|uniref:hypothetical protein n=1 Tax=Nocardia amamiensis TaxID=404578 RepID=UPI0033C60003